MVAGLAVSALHGAKWVDDDEPIELIWRNARPPHGVVTRADLLLDRESQSMDGLVVTTPERTGFDIGRRGTLDRAVARLDALAAATRVTGAGIAQLMLDHPGARGLPQLRAALDLLDGGAASPRETRLRLLLIRAGYPRPRTQIPVLSADGRRRYFLDMGWDDDVKIAVEYDGDHHRSDPAQFEYDIRRLADIDEIGWRLVRAAKRSRPDEVLARVQRAWSLRSAMR